MNSYWWEHNWPLVAIVTVIAILIGALIGSVNADAKKREEFLAECRQYRENYECVAMWRAGEPDVVPMPIVIPIR